MVARLVIAGLVPVGPFTLRALTDTGGMHQPAPRGSGRSRPGSRDCENVVLRVSYDLVLIDVDLTSGCRAPKILCDTIKKAAPGQHVAFVCNHRVSIERDCPDEIIRAEFKPDALLRGV
jgi:hypothetical protein